MMTKVFLLLALVAASYSQVFDRESCPQVQVVQDLDLKAFLGQWYELAIYWDNFQVDTKCYSGILSLASNGSLEVVQRYINTEDNTVQEVSGMATAVENTNEARFTMVFPVNTEISGEYILLGTDYENWNVIWSCFDLGEAGSFRNAWIWTRERNPSKEILDTAVSVLRKNNINTDLLLYVDNENCTSD